MSGSAHIEAEVEFVTAEAGGRGTPTFSGYRGQFYYHGMDWVAEHVYPEADKVLPGETVKTHVRFMSPDKHVGNLSVGMPFLIREGARTMAYGVITKLFDQLELDATAAE